MPVIGKPLNKPTRTFVASSAIALAITAFIAGPAMADSSNISATVTGGTLSVVDGGAQLTGTTLNGTSAQHATGGVTQWTITDARGTGAVWALSALATDFTSAAGTVDTTARTIAVSNLTISTGSISSVTGSDSAPAPITLSMSGTAQTLVSAGRDTKGTFTLTPTFDLTIPVNAYRSNFAGSIANAVPNPYISTVTYTLG